MRQTSSKTKLAIITGTLILTFMAASTLVWAKPTLNRLRMMEKIETIKMWKLMDALGLDSETALKVFPIIKETDRKRMDLRLKQRNVMEKIESQLKKGKEEGKNLDTLARQLFDLNEQISQFPREEYRKLKSILPETQLARYLLFQQRFRKEFIRRLMWDGRRKPVQERPRPGMRSGNGPMMHLPQSQP